MFQFDVEDMEQFRTAKMAINFLKASKRFMGRRARNAIPLKQIRVIVGSEVVIFDLDSSERLDDRRAAKTKMKSLKPAADELLQKEVVTSPALALHAVRNPPLPSLSIHHCTLLELEEMDRKLETFTPTCVSMIGGRHCEFA